MKGQGFIVCRDDSRLTPLLHCILGLEMRTLWIVFARGCNGGIKPGRSKLDGGDGGGWICATSGVATGVDVDGTPLSLGEPSTTGLFVSSSMGMDSLVVTWSVRAAACSKAAVECLVYMHANHFYIHKAHNEIVGKNYPLL